MYLLEKKYMRQRVFAGIEHLGWDVVPPRQETLVQLQEVVGPDPAATAAVYEDKFVDDAEELGVLRRRHDGQAAARAQCFGVAGLLV